MCRNSASKVRDWVRSSCLSHSKIYHRYHSHPEPSEAYHKERVFRKILSPGNCALAFDTNCDFKEGIPLTKRLSKPCYTVVAKMPQQPFSFGGVIRLTEVKFFMVSHQDL